MFKYYPSINMKKELNSISPRRRQRIRSKAWGSPFEGPEKGQVRGGQAGSTPFPRTVELKVFPLSAGLRASAAAEIMTALETYAQKRLPLISSSMCLRAKQYTEGVESSTMQACCNVHWRADEDRGEAKKLVVQDDIEEDAVHMDTTVVFQEAQPSHLTHADTHTQRRAAQYLTTSMEGFK